MSARTGTDVTTFISPNITFSSGVYTVTGDFEWSSSDWIRLGNDEEFNGNGYTITYSVSNTSGMFDSIANSDTTPSIIHDFHVIFTGSLVEYGGVIYRMNDSATTPNTYVNIYNCGVSTNSLGIQNNIGGLVGTDFGNAGICNINRCYFIGDITTQSSGGICAPGSGANGGTLVVEDCYMIGNVSNDNAGGISGQDAGLLGDLTIRNCYCSGTITGTEAGGITGKVPTFLGATINVYDSYTSGNVFGSVFGTVNYNDVPGEPSPPFIKSLANITNTIPSSPPTTWDGDNIWYFTTDATIQNFEYPKLRWHLRGLQLNPVSPNWCLGAYRFYKDASKMYLRYDTKYFELASPEQLSYEDLITYADSEQQTSSSITNSKMVVSLTPLLITPTTVIEPTNYATLTTLPAIQAYSYYRTALDTNGKYAVYATSTPLTAPYYQVFMNGSVIPIENEDTHTDDVLIDNIETPMSSPPTTSTTVNCFLKGQEILTVNGYVKVENIKKNDVIITEDNRQVPVLNVYHSKVLAIKNNLPSCIPKDYFEQNYPSEDTYVTQFHAVKYNDTWFLPNSDSNLIMKNYNKIFVDYYHIELPNYFNDTIVCKGGLITEAHGGYKVACGKTHIYENIDNTPFFKKKLIIDNYDYVNATPIYKSLFGFV